MPDQRVKDAIAHWSHRFVSAGVPLYDFETVTASVENWSEWCGRWVERGRVHEALGEAALEKGHTIAAGEHFQRAALCHHFGKFVFVEYFDEMRAAHELAVAAYERAVPLLDPPGEAVAIPFEDGQSLKGVLRLPKGVERPPVVLMVAGLDSTKEEMNGYGDHILRRGLATLAFDGPGQGEAEYDIPMRHDFEVAAAACIDFLEGRDDVDAARVGIYGVSLGGYYAPRSTAFEPRIRACVAVSGAYSIGGLWDDLPAATRATFKVRSHSQTDEDVREFVGRMDLDGVAGRIAVPLYVVAGDRDRITPHQGAERLAAEAQGPTVLDVVEGGSHVVNNMPFRYRPQTADWLADVLRA